MHPVVAAELRQLRIDLRIIPIGLEHRRLEVVQVEQQRGAAEMAKRILQAAQESLGILPQYRLAVALARIAQHHPQHPTPARLAALFLDRRSQAEIHLHLLARLALHSPHPRRLALLELGRKPFHRLVGARKPALLHQILIDALGAQPGFQLRANRGRKRLALALSAQRSGARICRSCSKRTAAAPGGRNERYTLTPLPHPSRGSRWW